MLHFAFTMPINSSLAVPEVGSMDGKTQRPSQAYLSISGTVRKGGKV